MDPCVCVPSRPVTQDIQFSFSHSCCCHGFGFDIRTPSYTFLYLNCYDWKLIEGRNMTFVILIQICRKQIECLFCRLELQQTNGKIKCGSPVLVDLGGESCSEDCGFESQHHILDKHFFKYICYKNVNVCLKRRKLNKKTNGKIISTVMTKQHKMLWL